MTKEIRPPKVVANGDPEKQFNNPIQIDYNTANPQLKQQLNLLATTICSVWPETASNKEKATLALAGALLRNGWVTVEVQHFLESILKITGDLNGKKLTAVDKTENRIKLGKPVYGWPTLAELIGDDVTAQVQQLVRAIDDDNKNDGTQIEILDNAPLEVRKPLCLIENRAYAATWLYVKFTETETVDKDGNITKLNPPQQKEERRLAIINEDGEVIYDKTQRFYELGFSVILSETPQAEKLWSSHGVRRFKDGERVEAQKVFHEIIDVINAFIDFDKSLGEQRQMSEFITCYILGTWFLSE